MRMRNSASLWTSGPRREGHSLILPKEHYANLYEIPEDLAADAAKLAKKLAIRMTEKLGADGFNIIQNNNEAAGQTVPHYHVHLIPRYQNDGQHILWNPGELPAEEMDEILNTILAD